MNDDQDTSAELDALAMEAESLEGEFLAGDSPQPSGDPEGPSQRDQLAKMIGKLVDLTHNAVLAPKRGDHWKMQADEADAHGEAYADVIVKYFPDLNLGPELTLFAVLSMSYGPRLMVDGKLKKKAKADEAAADQSASEPDPQEPLGDKV